MYAKLTGSELVFQATNPFAQTSYIQAQLLHQTRMCQDGVVLVRAVYDDVHCDVGSGRSVLRENLQRWYLDAFTICSKKPCLENHITYLVSIPICWRQFWARDCTCLRRLFELRPAAAMHIVSALSYGTINRQILLFFYMFVTGINMFVTDLNMFVTFLFVAIACIFIPYR